MFIHMRNLEIGFLAFKQQTEMSCSFPAKHLLLRELCCFKVNGRSKETRLPIGANKIVTLIVRTSCWGHWLFPQGKTVTCQLSMSRFSNLGDPKNRDDQYFYCFWMQILKKRARLLDIGTGFCFQLHKWRAVQTIHLIWTALFHRP